MSRLIAHERGLLGTTSTTFGLGLRAATAIIVTACCSELCLGAEPLPRYPDTWEWIVPTAKSEQLDVLEATLLDDGDVLMTSVSKGAETNKPKLWLLFSQRQLDTSAQLPDGRVLVKPGTYATPVRASTLDAVLGEGFGITERSNSYRLCYGGPARNVIVKRDRPGHIVSEAVIFFLLDRPRTFEGGGGKEWRGEADASCPDEGPVRVKYQVASLHGTFLALPDSTVLLLDAEDAVIVRLRADLKMGRPSPSGRLAVFDYQDNDYVIDRYTKKPYRLTDGTPAYQEMLDDLYQLIVRSTRK